MPLCVMWLRIPSIGGQNITNDKLGTAGQTGNILCDGHVRHGRKHIWESAGKSLLI